MKFRPPWRLTALLWLLGPPPASAVRSREAGLAPSLGARLQKVREILESEDDQDKKVSERMACWCKTGLAEKRRYAEDLSQQSDSLLHEVQAKTAENARLATELEQHRAELQDSEESLSKAAAIREKAARKFSEEHTLTSQSINQLDGALEALRSSHGHELSVVQQMRRLLDGSRQAKQGSMLQLRRRLDSASSPQVVYGVLKQMRQTFEANLKDMQEDDSLMKSRHDELSQAKAQEIETIKRQVAAKQQRVAEGGLHVSRQKEVMERTGKLLEATRTLLSAMDKACDGSDKASQERQTLRQQSLVALSAAQAELAGAQLLATSAAQGRASGGGPQDLCLLASSLSEQRWRERAQAACAAAKAGRTQEAAEAAEGLEEDIKQAVESTSSELEQCGRAHQELASQHARAAEEADVRARVIGSTKHGADSQIDEVEAQAGLCQKAKTELSEIRQATQAMLHSIQADAGRIATLLRAASSSAPTLAVTKLNEVTAGTEKLAQAAASFGGSSERDAQEVGAALDGALQAASKALIPLRLIRADAEEAAASVHEEQERSAHTASKGPACDSAALSAKVQRLQGHVKSLEDATVALAWGSLR